MTNYICMPLRNFLSQTLAAYFNSTLRIIYNVLEINNTGEVLSFLFNERWQLCYSRICSNSLNKWKWNKRKKKKKGKKYKNRLKGSKCFVINSCMVQLWPSSALVWKNLVSTETSFTCADTEHCQTCLSRIKDNTTLT